MTSTELAIITQDEAALAALDRHAVVELLERGKSWLQQALARDTGIGELVTYKGEAQVLRELVVQKELGKDAELAATELIRRAERAIGKGIRKGQEAGAIRKPRQGGGWSARHLEDGDTALDEAAPVSPYEFVPRHELTGGGAQSGSGIYAMTDDVTDEQFDDALDEAKAEANLSRANVVRKVKKRPPPAARRPRELRRTRRLDGDRVIDGIVDTAANLITPSLLEEIDFSELDPERLHEWIEALGPPQYALRRLRDKLQKELNHV